MGYADRLKAEILGKDCRQQDSGLKTRDLISTLSHRWAQMKHRWENPDLKDMVYWIFPRRSDGGEEEITPDSHRTEAWR